MFKLHISLLYGRYLITQYERMIYESRRLEEQIHDLQKQTSNFPAGKLVCAFNGKYCKWYVSDGHQKHYLPKKMRHLAEQLAAKKYITLLIDELSQEKRAVDFYLKHHNPENSKSAELLNNPEYSDLLSSFFTPISKELTQWMNAPYTTNQLFSEQLIHKSISGHLLRSKSESMIDTFLYLNKIPFRYECALHLGESTIFPDFTIRHPVTGQTYYWEHFGLMDNPKYYKNVYSKLQLYTSCGIVPSIQLITTFETQNHPLSSEIIEKLVTHYFL